MPAEWSSSLDTPDAMALVGVLGALFGGELQAEADAIEAAMRDAARGDHAEHRLDSEVGPLEVQWIAEDATTTDVFVFGPEHAIAAVDSVFDPEDAAATSEGLYRHGVGLWAGRRLVPAQRVLRNAAAFAARDPLQAWGAAIDRALAQIALELDDPDAAEQHLTAFLPQPVAAFQHLAVQSRVLLLRGDHDGAAQKVSTGVSLIGAVALDDVPDLMNTSIGLVHMAEVLLELGFATSAGRLASIGQALVAQAGVTDPVVSAALALAAARAAGMVGAADAGAQLLAQVDASLDPDLDVQVRAEQARARWRAGDPAAARAGFDEAIEVARAAELRATARLLAAERDGEGPRTAREEPGPVETWAGGAAAGDHRPYAVVVTLVVQGSTDRYAALEDAVAALLEQRPDLGEVDGIGSDGTIWDLFLDGDDGPALWAAVEPIVLALDPPAGSTVRIRTHEGDVVERPLRP
jgi:hypothetical protein